MRELVGSGLIVFCTVIRPGSLRLRDQSLQLGQHLFDVLVVRELYLDDVVEVAQGQRVVSLSRSCMVSGRPQQVLD